MNHTKGPKITIQNNGNNEKPKHRVPRNLFGPNINNKPITNLTTGKPLEVNNNLTSLNKMTKRKRNLFGKNSTQRLLSNGTRRPEEFRYNNSNNNRMQVNRVTYTGKRQKQIITNYTDPIYQDPNLTNHSVLNNFTVSKEIEDVLKYLSDQIRDTIAEKANSNCNTEQFKESLKTRICDNNPNMICVHGGSKIVLNCKGPAKCDYVYMFDFKKSINDAGDDIFMADHVADMSDLDDIVLSGPLYYRPVLVKTTSSSYSGPNIRFDFMISHNYGNDVLEYLIEHAVYFSDELASDHRRYLLAVCVLLTLLFSVSKLHERNICHCDIKCENLMTGDISSQTPNVKNKHFMLIDFGLFTNDNKELFPPTDYNAKGTPELLTKRIIGYAKKQSVILNLNDYKDLDLHSIGFTAVLILANAGIEDILNNLNELKGLPVMDYLYNNDNNYVINKVLSTVNKNVTGTKLKIINIVDKLSRYGYSTYTINTPDTNQAQVLYDDLVSIVKGDVGLIRNLSNFLTTRNLHLHPQIMTSLGM